MGTSLATLRTTLLKPLECIRNEVLFYLETNVQSSKNFASSDLRVKL